MSAERVTRTCSVLLFVIVIFLFSAGKVLSHEINHVGCHLDAAKDQHHCHLNGEETPIPKYQRKYFGRWLDFDGDCQNTRHELLIDLNVGALSFSGDFCSAVRGRWFDPYSGETFFESSELDIDHLVPLKFAWDHGAYAWDRKKRYDFANDNSNLIAVQKSLNRQKGASGPIEWMPPNERFHCQYLLRFWRVLRRFEIDFYVSEKASFKNLKRINCDF